REDTNRSDQSRARERSSRTASNHARGPSVLGTSERPVLDVFEAAIWNGFEAAIWNGHAYGPGRERHMNPAGRHALRDQVPRTHPPSRADAWTSEDLPPVEVICAGERVPPGGRRPDDD